MCQQSSRDLVFQIPKMLSCCYVLFFFFFFSAGIVCMHSVVTYNSRAQWCKKKQTNKKQSDGINNSAVLGQNRPSEDLQHNVRKAEMVKHDCQQLTSVLLPKSSPNSLSHTHTHTHSHTHTHTHTHTETHSPHSKQHMETGDFWFQYRPPTITPRMVHCHANHAKNNENVFI